MILKHRDIRVPNGNYFRLSQFFLFNEVADCLAAFYGLDLSSEELDLQSFDCN